MTRWTEIFTERTLTDSVHQKLFAHHYSAQEKKNYQHVLQEKWNNKLKGEFC